MRIRGKNYKMFLRSGSRWSNGKKKSIFMRIMTVDRVRIGQKKSSYRGFIK